MASSDEKACVNVSGASIGDNVHEMPGRAFQVRDGVSALLDLVWAYSIHHIVEPQAASVQNRRAKIAPMGAVELPFTMAATAALVSTHSTKVRFKRFGHSSAHHTIRMAAHSSKRKIGDSSGMLCTIARNHSGRCVETVCLELPVNAAAIWPSPWASVCAPTGVDSVNGVVRGGRFPSAEYRQMRFSLRSSVSVGGRCRYWRIMRCHIVPRPSLPSNKEV